MPYCASQWLWMTGERECATGQPRRPAIPKVPRSAIAWRSVALSLLAGRQWRQRCDHLLLSVDHLGHEAFAIEIAVVIEADVHEHTRVLLRRQPDPVHGIGESFRIELADLLGDRLDDEHARVALQAVVIGLVVVFLLEFARKGSDAGIGRIRGETHVRDRAVPGFAGELDYFLARQHGLADDRLVVGLLLELPQCPRRFLLVGIDE